MSFVKLELRVGSFRARFLSLGLLPTRNRGMVVGLCINQDGRFSSSLEAISLSALLAVGIHRLLCTIDDAVFSSATVCSPSINNLLSFAEVGFGTAPSMTSLPSCNVLLLIFLFLVPLPCAITASLVFVPLSALLAVVIHILLCFVVGVASSSVLLLLCVVIVSSCVDRCFDWLSACLCLGSL